MMKKLNTLLIGIILLSLIISSVSALTINRTVTETSILYEFDPPRDPDYPAKVFFNNEEIFTPINDSLLMTGLEPNTEYCLVVHYPSDHPVKPDEHYQVSDTTLENKSSLSYLIGTFSVIIIVMLILYLGRSIPYSGYIATLIAFGGFVWVIKSETDFIIVLAHVLLFFIAGIFAATQEVK